MFLDEEDLDYHCETDTMRCTLEWLDSETTSDIQPPISGAQHCERRLAMAQLASDARAMR